MNTTNIKTIVVAISLLIMGCGDDDENNIDAASTQIAEEADGLVVMEAENTSYSQTMFQLVNANNMGRSGKFGTGDVQFDGVLEDFKGQGYLEYAGPDSFREPTDTFMVYSFRINNPGTYYLFLRAFENHAHDPDIDNETLFEGDRNNDAYVRMEGDYTDNVNFSESGGRPGATKNELDTFNKFFCSSNDTNPAWGRSTALEPDDFKDPNYVFKAGETYNLYITGRSTQLAIDRIYLVRLADQNGHTDGESIYSFKQFRDDVDNGRYDASEIIQR